jgi:hypothetical protein
MSEIDTQVRILQHAISMLGPSFLAASLDSSYRDIQRWSSGEEQMPRSLLDRTADLILAKYHGLPWAGVEAGQVAARC